MIKQPLILASDSLIRAHILRQAGLDFSVVSPLCDEDSLKDSIKDKESTEQALFLAEAKALSVSRQHAGLVIGADQILVMGGEVLSKVRTGEEARKRLLAMRGTSHCLVGGLVVCEGGQSIWRHTSQAVLHVRNFSEHFLDTYLEKEGESLLHSVACYRYEGMGAQLFERVEGSYFAILGLDLLPLLACLRQRGGVLL